MWGKFKWDMFVTSFIPLWLSIVVIGIWNDVFLMFPKEISRSFLWKHEKNGHKNIPWILGRTDGENTYNF